MYVTRVCSTLVFTATTAAWADQPAAVRVSRHDDAVRVVVETAQRTDFQQTFSADGATALITAKSTSPLQVPAEIHAPGVSVQAPPQLGTSPLQIHFPARATLTHKAQFPPIGKFGYRYVLDFAVDAAMAQAATARASSHGMTAPEALKARDLRLETLPPLPAQAVASVPPPQPVAATAGASTAGVSVAENGELLPGCRLPSFGASENETINAIQEQFGSGKPFAEIKTTAVGGNELMLVLRAPIGDLGTARIVFFLELPEKRLTRVDFDWGSGTGAVLTEEEIQRLTRALVVQLNQRGFTASPQLEGHARLKSPRVIYAGIDPQDRLSAVEVNPETTLPMVPDGTVRQIVRLSVTRSDQVD